MIARHIAVIDQTNAISAGKLARVTAAVQKQVMDHFAPKWGVTASVDDFPTLADKPPESWPVVIRKRIGIDEAGAHVSADGEHAFALVRFTPNSDDWVVTLSHEILEMLADPLGTDTISGSSPFDDGLTVDYLREVCDPCQGPDRAEDPDFMFQYVVDGEFMSDFVFPDYYTGFGSGRYSHTGRITRPRELLNGGYYVWQEPITSEWKYTYFDGTTTTTDSLGRNLSRPDIHLRGLIDRKVAAATQRSSKRRRKRPPLGVASDRAAQYSAATAAQATWWQREIDRVTDRRTRQRRR